MTAATPAAPGSAIVLLAAGPPAGVGFGAAAVGTITVAGMAVAESLPAGDSEGAAGVVAGCALVADALPAEGIAAAGSSTVAGSTAG